MKLKILKARPPLLPNNNVTRGSLTGRMGSQKKRMLELCKKLRSAQKSGLASTTTTRKSMYCMSVSVVLCIHTRAL